MVIKKESFGSTKSTLGGGKVKFSAVDKAYFLYYDNGRQGDVFGTKGAMAMLCLDILSQCPELKNCRIGTFRSRKEQILNDEEILYAAAQYAKRDHGAVPSLRAGINLTSWRKVEEAIA